MVEIIENYYTQQKKEEPEQKWKYHFPLMDKVIEIAERTVKQPDDMDNFVFELKLFDEKERQKSVIEGLKDAKND